MKVYLASPFFNKKEIEVKRQVRERIEQFGWELYDPQSPSIDSHSWEKSNSDWGHDTFMNDVHAINECDAVIAIDWGLYGDCGTSWEIGYAYGIDKDIIVLVPNETFTSPHSLMIANGCDNFIAISRFLTISEDDIVKDAYFLRGVEQK